MAIRFSDARTANRLALAAVAVAVWLAGTRASARAGCGDYLVGVNNADHDRSASVMPDHSGKKLPECRSCHEPPPPLAPVIVVERVPADPALGRSDSPPELRRGGWPDTEASLLVQGLSQTPDRPPKR